ncbi:MAG: hypothetical protein Q9228_008007, partial [Teloschistes exilis]
MVDLIRRLSVKSSKRHTRPDQGLNESAEAVDLDVDFYRSFYLDLRDLSSKAAVDHWTKHGFSEGRISNAYGLPDDFRAYDYVAANADLIQICADAPGAVQHYLRYGQAEHRNYRLGGDDAAFIEAFRSRSKDGIAVVDPRWMWAPSNAESYMRYAGFKEIGFLNEFD